MGRPGTGKWSVHSGSQPPPSDTFSPSRNASVRLSVSDCSGCWCCAVAVSVGIAVAAVTVTVGSVFPYSHSHFTFLLLFASFLSRRRFVRRLRFHNLRLRLGIGCGSHWLNCQTEQQILFFGHFALRSTPRKPDVLLHTPSNNWYLLRQASSKKQTRMLDSQIGVEASNFPEVSHSQSDSRRRSPEHGAQAQSPAPSAQSTELRAMAAIVCSSHSNEVWLQLWK